MGEELIPENSTIFLCKCTDTSVTQDSAYSVPTPFRFRNHGDFRSFPFSPDGLVLNTTGFDPSLFFNYIFYIHVFISVWIMASRKKKQQNRQKKNYFSSFCLIYRHQFVDEERCPALKICCHFGVEIWESQYMINRSRFHSEREWDFDRDAYEALVWFDCRDPHLEWEKPKNTFFLPFFFFFLSGGEWMFIYFTEGKKVQTVLQNC